jgi:hypothetical protein
MYADIQFLINFEIGQVGKKIAIYESKIAVLY